jgi:hypothetical protein
MAKKKITKKTKAMLPSAPPPDFGIPIRELELAYHRINGTPTRRLRWLLEFAYLDLNKLSEGRLADLRQELLVFGLNRNPANPLDIALDFHLLTFPLPMNESIPRSEIEKLISKGTTEEEHKQHDQAVQAERRKGAPLWLMNRFQETMRAAFDKLFEGEQWRVTRPSHEEGIAINVRNKDGALWAQNPPSFTAEEILLIQAIDLIKAEKARLKRCENPKCSRSPRFVAAKKTRARFCSAKCSAYVRVNKARGKM